MFFFRSPLPPYPPLIRLIWSIQHTLCRNLPYTMIFTSAIMHQQVLIPSSPLRFPLKGFIYKGSYWVWFSIVNAARLYHSHINLERASCWKIKVKRKQQLHPQWVQLPGHMSWSERIRVDIRKMEGNKTPKPNRSIKGWCGVKDRNCQGLPAAKWNQFLWVQACQDVVCSNRRLQCFTNQWKGTGFWGFPRIYVETWRYRCTTDEQLRLLSRNLWSGSDIHGWRSHPKKTLRCVERKGNSGLKDLQIKLGSMCTYWSTSLKYKLAFRPLGFSWAVQALPGRNRMGRHKED